MNSFGIVLFHTTSSALRAEQVLKKGGVGIKLVAAPRDLSSDCNIAIRFGGEDTERVRQLLLEARVEVAGIHGSL